MERCHSRGRQPDLERENTVEGAVVSGLNVALGQTLPQGAVGNGQKTYQYNSCNVAKAMAKMAQLVGYSNAWVDNWPTY